MKKNFYKISKVNDINFNLDAFYIAEYENITADAIKLVKFKPSKLLAKELAIIATDTLLDNWHYEIPDYVIPVPLHKQRLMIRGFNQAEVYSKYIASAFNTTHANILIRKKITKYQAECQREERLHNVYNAFELQENINKLQFKNKKLCLIDDVITTGSTMNECVKVLKKLNPSRLFCLALAHSVYKS